MRRRSFVAVLAFASAGCVEGGGEAAGPAEPDENSTDEDTETEDEETTAGDGNQEAVDEYRDILARIPPNPSASGSDILAEFGTAGLTASGFGFRGWRARLVEDGDEESPPRTRIAQANMSDETEEFELASLPPYDGVAENEDGDVMHAVPTEEHDLAKDTPEVTRDDGAWYLEGEHDRDDWLPRTFELAPETGYVGEYFLVSEDGELGEGDYVFEGDESGSVGVGLTVSAWRTGSPGPSEESRFEPESLPGGAKGERLSFYHDADEETESYLKPSKELVELSAQEEAEMEFELTNRSEMISNTPDWSWSLHKLVDGNWELVDMGQGGRIGEFRVVWPGRRIRRRVRYSASMPDVDDLISVGGGKFAYLDTEGNGNGDSGYDSDDHGSAVHTYDATRVVGPIGGGTYAYDMSVSFGDEVPAAAFEVGAPPISVEPPEDASAERDGERVVVTAGDEPESAFVVERTDREDVEVVPSEALYGVENSLRYAVPFFNDGVEVVRVEADEETVDDAFPSELKRTFEHKGTTYGAEKE